MYKGQKNNGGIAILFVCVLVLAVFVAAACTNGFTTANPYGWFDKKEVETVDGAAIANVLEIQEVTASANIRLFTSGEAVTASDNTVSQTITATVLPSDAPNKAVDWQIYWADDAALKNQPIGNYLTLTPESDGSTTATLTCKQSFRGSNAYVKVTTRVGSFYAVASVFYSGMPSEISIDATGYSHIRLANDTEHASVSDSYYPYGVVVGEDNVFPINMDNVFHDVGTNFASQLDIEIIGYGYVNLQHKPAGSTAPYQVNKISLNEIKDDILSVRIANGNLVIHPNCKLQDYYKQTSEQTSMFHSLSDYPAVGGSIPQPHYFTVRISYGANTDKYCTAVVNVTIVTAVQSVSLDPTAIVF